MDAIKKLPYDNQFIVLEEFPNGGVLRRHILANETYPDYELVFLIGWEKAEIGCRVDILPILHAKDSLRKIIFPDGKGFKCPDLRINGILYEVENPQNPTKKYNLKHRISDGAKQANYIIVNLNEPVNINIKRAACKGRFIDYKDLLEIEFRDNGVYEVFKRSDFVYGINERPI